MEFLLMLGPPGAGKGTVSRIVEQRAGFEHFSTGDTIRRHMADPASTFGQRARPYMDRGEYIPDAMALELFHSVVPGRSPDARLVLDGFPRTVPQAEHFSRWLEETRNRMYGCFSLQVSTGEAVQRLQKRRGCPACGASYHLEVRPPRQPGQCDRCGTPLVLRADDSAALIEKRLRIFQEHTRALIDWYAARGSLHVVDAGRPPREVAGDVLRLAGLSDKETR